MDEMINKVIHAKIEDVIDDLPEIDLLLTDPPYGIGESGGKSKSRGKLANADKYTEYNWDILIKQEIIDKLISKANQAVIWGGNYYKLQTSSCWLIWNKLLPENDFADCEMAWTNLPGAVRKIDYLWNGMIKEVPEKRFHPTQKPEAVMNFCLDQFEKKMKRKPKLVLDPFAGSGTTLVCCKKRGIDYIGVEMIEEYVDIINKRLSQETLF